MAGRAEFWSGHIAAQLASGSTQRAYCERHGLQPRNFRRWARRSQGCDEVAAPPGAPVEVEATAAEVVPRPGADDRTSTRTEGVTEDVALPPPVPEVLVGPERRRRWTSEQKLALVMQTLAPGASLSLVARRHGVHSSVLFRWRRQLATRVPGAQGPVEPAGGATPRLAPVRVVPAPPEAVAAPSPAPAAVPALRPAAGPSTPAVQAPAPDGVADGATSGRIEIELAGGARVWVDRHVDADAPRRVLAALAGAGSAAP